MTPEPVAVSEPPVIDNPPLIVELAATVSPPPEMTSGSVAVMLSTDSTSVLIVMVGLPATRRSSTSSVGPGTPLLQLLGHVPGAAAGIDPGIGRQELAAFQDLHPRWRRFSRLEDRFPRRDPKRTDSGTWCRPPMMVKCHGVKNLASLPIVVGVILADDWLLISPT